jgi:hypothetical protein
VGRAKVAPRPAEDPRPAENLPPAEDLRPDQEPRLAPAREPLARKAVPPADRTKAITIAMPPPPVFVDDTGSRHRRMLAVVTTVAVTIVLLAVAVWASQSGTPVQPAPVVTCGSGHAAGCASR